MPEAYVTQAVPLPANQTPKTDSNSPAIGNDPMRYALEDHQHPRVASSTPVILDANGTGVATFSRTFATRPKASFSQEPVGDGDTVTGPPCVFRVKSWIKTGADFTGANVEGFMLSPPTGLAAVNVLGISVAVGGQTYVTFGPAAAVAVSCIMLPNSAAA